MAATGARRGELLALRWFDADLVAGTLSFQRSFIEGAEGPDLVPTKTHRSHQVALDAASVAELVTHRERLSRLDDRIVEPDPVRLLLEG